MEGRGSVQLCGRVALFELNNIFGFEKVFGEPYPPLILEGAGYQVLKIARLSGIIVPKRFQGCFRLCLHLFLPLNGPSS